jgi:hypothetical protein
MRPGAFQFARKWMETVKHLGETGMGYTVVSITLSDGRVFPQAVIDSSYMSRIRSLPDVLFSEDDVSAIKQTNEKWDWSKKL